MHTGCTQDSCPAAKALGGRKSECRQGSLGITAQLQQGHWEEMAWLRAEGILREKPRSLHHHHYLLNHPSHRHEGTSDVP